MKMAYWDSQNGWIQFVFANEQDSYYLPSLMRVSFYRYLLYNLKKSGYEAVYFWEEHEGKYEFGYMDEASAQHYVKIRPKGFIEKIFSGPSNGAADTNVWTSVQTAPDVMEKLFYGIAGSRKKTALIVPITVFERFFSNNGRAKELLERNRRQNHSGNLVLLTASVKAEESNRCLTEEKGVLPRLFEEVRQAAMPDGIRHLYEKLKDNLSDRCVYLNELDRNMIRNIVRKNCVFDGQGRIPVSADMIEKMTDVIDWFYHSEAFRRETPIHLPENQKREYLIIDKSLQNQRNCDVMIDWIEQTAGAMSADAFREYLRNHFLRENSGCYIYTDSFLLRQWDQLRVPPEMFQNKPEWQSSMSRCRRILRMMVLRGDESIDKVNLELCMDQLRRSLADMDINTFDYGLKAMAYLLDTSYEQTESRNSIWDFYKKIFELSEEIQRLDHKKDNYNQKVLMYTTEWKELLNRIEILKKSARDISSNAELNILMKRAVECKKEIKTNRNNLSINKSMRFTWRQSIDTLEQHILEIQSGHSVNVQLALTQAMDMHQKVIQQNMDAMKDANRLTEKIPEMLDIDDEQVFTEPADFERYFQEMKEKLDQMDLF